MASFFKPTITTYRLPDGKHRTPDGQRVTRATPGAVKVSHRSEIWYGKFKTADGIIRRVPLCTDKGAAKQMLAKLVTDAKMAQLGMVDAFEEHRRRPLAEHLKDFHRYLEAEGNTPKHARQTCRRVQAVLAGCGVAFMPDLSASAVVEWLAGERKAGRLGIKTSNYYLRDAKAFCRWLVRDRRASASPLAYLSGMNAAVEAGRQRRNLSEEAFAAFVAAAREGGIVRGLPGRERAMLYTVAAYVGFRAREMASLTPESFELDSDPPGVTVAAAYSKRRRRDTQPLRPDLAASLLDWLKEKPAGGGLWPGSWWKHAAKMVRRDLEAAGIPFEDAGGRVFDFHALRHQFISNLAAAGVHPKVAQALARHSTIGLTMDRYTHVGLFDQVAALDALPALPEGGKEYLAATGTDSTLPRLDRALTKPMRLPAPRMTTVETPPPAMTASRHLRKPLEMKAFANDCERMTTGENQKAPPGFEPGLADLQSAATIPQTGKGQGTSGKPQKRPDRALTKATGPEGAVDPDLARLVDAWPALPEPIRRAMLAMVGTAGPADLTRPILDKAHRELGDSVGNRGRVE